ncbi:hypothetical protein JTE90_025142 [Oedothorax gibbosus]|uniref:Prohormone-3 n=1 Tax=Oedothorax gibbosus TaxID=931172 RepID=A0AAV6UJZ5_9ARAC|nr:hypothetical protein JTE90_025142 [Oedothorax gibbosus]
MAVICVTIFLMAAFIYEASGQYVFPDGVEVGNWGNGEIQTKRGGGAEGLEALLSRDEDYRCYGKTCQHSEECCRGTTCVDIEGASGTCLPTSGRQMSYQSCNDDAECSAGLSCTESGGYYKTCQLDTASIHKKAGFNDECVNSSECDTDHGLCCQILRGHRVTTRRVCHYFLDPKSCIGEFRAGAKELKFVANPFFKARLG